MQFKCGEQVKYRDEVGVIVGKTYGHSADPRIGRSYDVKLPTSWGRGHRVVNHVPERELGAYGE